MADVKIPVTAGVKGVTDELDAVEKKIDSVSRAAGKLGRLKFQPIDVKAIEQDLKRLEKLYADFHKRVAQAANAATGGTTPMPPGPGPAPAPASPPAPRQPTPSQPRGRRGRGAYTYAPEFYDVGQHLLSGVGGGFGQIASYGTRGAIAGARDGGGFMGGGTGLLRGLGIGALAYGAFKVGQGVTEGYDLAKDRAGSLDNLKRQMGDVGISFERLKVMSEAAADGLGMTSKESAKLMEEFNRASRGADGSPTGLTDSVRTATGFSRAYGLDPAVGVGFFGGMRNIDPRQNNRELAVLLAETIDKSGMSSRADEVMQAVQSFASATSRMSLTAPNINAYAGAYSSMLAGRTPGLTSEVAAGLLGQANSSMMQMGGAGEAGQNFILQSLMRGGKLDPIQARALAEGGLFGTRRGVFSNGSLTNWIGNPGGAQDITNFEAVRDQMRAMGGPRSLQLEGLQRLFRLPSLASTSALMDMDPNSMGRLRDALRKAGVDINTLNPTGIQALAKLGPNATVQELQSAAKSGREETEFTRMLDSMKSIEEAQVKVGDKLLEPITKIKEAVVYTAGMLGFKEKPAPVVPQTGGASGSWAPSTGGASGSWSAPGAAGGGRFSDVERKYGLPSGILTGMWGAESSFGKNTGFSSAGASGHLQWMPDTAKRYGVTIGDLNSEADGAGRYLRDLYKQRGSWKGALFGYNGVVNNTHLGEDYVRKVEKFGNLSIDDSITPMPSGSNAQGSGGRSSGHADPVHVDVVIHPRGEDGKPAGSPVRTKVSVPRGAGAN